MTSFEFLGPYRLGESIGHGGMGSVFEAVHEKSGEKVAVKLIAQHVADDMRFRRRFHTEIKTLQRLRHPGIVRLIGYGEEKGRLFYSMELVEGEALHDRIRREKRIDWRSTIDVAIQICSALKHAHDIGVFHRDLKPANLLLTADDSVKIVDFGIAKDYFDDHQTLAGAVLGTADYMAPEQATGSGCTAQTDLYALGSVMYAMLTGRPPFTGKNITDVIESLKRDRPIPLDMVNPDIPQDLVELVHQLLEKSPQDRPPTALAVMNRLKAMRAGLQREQTIAADNLPTRGDSESSIRSSDTDLIRDQSSAATGVAEPAGTDREKRRHERGPTVVAKRGQAQAYRASPHEVTVASSAGQTALPGDDEAIPEEVTTHFQTVDRDAPTESLLRDPPADPGGRAWHAAAIGFLIAILIGCGWWLVESTARPSADQAYAKILAGAPVQATEDFLSRFPDDPRVTEVLAIQMEARISRTEKRLRTQARLAVTPLTVTQVGFLEAMELRQSDPPQAAKQILAWLDVYANGPDADAKGTSELIELATYEHQRLTESSPAPTINEKAAELIAQIQQRVESGSVEESRRMLDGIVRLYQDKPWARPALEEARRQLQALDEFAAPPESNDPPADQSSE